MFLFFKFIENYLALHNIFWHWESSCWEGDIYLLIPTPFCVLSLTKNSHELKEEEKERKKKVVNIQKWPQVLLKWVTDPESLRVYWRAYYYLLLRDQWFRISSAIPIFYPSELCSWTTNLGPSDEYQEEWIELF